MRAVTGDAASNVLTAAANHGLRAGNRVVFRGLVGGSGLVEGDVYYVISAGLTDSAFEVSATSGGAAVNFTTDVTAGRVYRRQSRALHNS